jgi:carbon monoxide dehydrogenase subunit G
LGIDVTVTTEINRRAQDVAAFAMEAENDTRWIGGISEAHRVTSGPTALGTRVQRRASFLGKRIDYLMEVVELEPGRRIVMRSIKSPFPMKVTYAFEPEGSKTTASVRVEGDPGGFYKLTSGLMAPAVRRNLNGDLRRLKEILESKH